MSIPFNKIVVGTRFKMGNYYTGWTVSYEIVRITSKNFVYCKPINTENHKEVKFLKRHLNKGLYYNEFGGENYYPFKVLN